ncbi:hypothetical protein BBC27_06175 [Acidithiobacillus ferrivorans]|uniref:Uncharacterized protein n=1 Tax=Acidithiobacillus ferrivorans TaxID=160808 RepID=A0A1B9C1H5_9PROT|nr:hypothetical protein [Acidithiobacillus ferrivorans]OCB03829.1 hypothetical protein BBC27_06175 [Acidithiobacillus ferrivorans]
MLHWFLTTLAALIHAASPILKAYGLPAMFALLFVESAGVVFAPGEAMIEWIIGTGAIFISLIEKTAKT